MRWAILVVVIGCNSSHAIDYHECPSAPFRQTGPLTCDFAGSCKFTAPRSYGDDYDPCNDLSCSCQDGGLRCASFLIGCSCKPNVCPSGATQGATCVIPPAPTQICAWGANAECVVPGPGANLDAGIVKGETCACDLPGPIWRCRPIATL